MTQRSRARHRRKLWMLFALSLTIAFLAASQPYAAAVPAGKGKPSDIALTFNKDPKTSLAFAWYTPDGVTGTRVQVIEASTPNAKLFPEADTLTFEGTSSSVSVYHNKKEKDAKTFTTYISHKASATGLAPGTAYLYRLGDGTEGNWSAAAGFTTEPAEAEAFTFLYTTDSQGAAQKDYRIWADTLRQGVKQFPDAAFNVITGDQVDNGDYENQWHWFFTEPADILASLPLVPLVGNHESKKYDNFTHHFNLPDTSQTYAKPKGSVYTFAYGHARFYALNTEYYGASPTQTQRDVYAAQVEWLKKAVAASGSRWNIVLMHKSPYSTGSHTDDADVLYYRKHLTQVFDQLGIDIVLGGHDHTYFRSHPMLNGKPQTSVDKDAAGAMINPQGTIYLLGNTAGPKFYPLQKGTYPFANLSRQPGKQVFTGVTVTEETLSFQAYTVGSNGTAPKLLDQFAITRP